MDGSLSFPETRVGSCGDIAPFVDYLLGFLACSVSLMFVRLPRILTIDDARIPAALLVDQERQIKRVTLIHPKPRRGRIKHLSVRPRVRLPSIRISIQKRTSEKRVIEAQIDTPRVEKSDDRRVDHPQEPQCRTAGDRPSVGRGIRVPPAPSG
jgi:hypothetical protein